MKISRLIELIFLVIILVSCDPGSCSTTTFENETKGPLDMVLFSTNQGDIQTRTFRAESKDRIDIFHDCSLGMLSHTFPQDLGIDSMRFEFPGIFTITFTEDLPGKNSFDKDDWIQSIKRKFPAGSNVTTIFEISEEDLIAWQ